MKKAIFAILVGILSFMGFNFNVQAAEPPKSFVAKEVIKLPEYVPGIVSFYKPIGGGLEVFCEDEGYTYLTNLTYGLWEIVDDGYIYILEHRPNTGDSKKDYYIQSVAVWWYKDYLNNTDFNIPKEKKDYIIEHKDTDEVCKLIYNLFEGAKKYKQVKGSIKFNAGDISFTEEGDYYVSDKITLTGKALTSSKVELIDAPTGSTIINNTVKKGNGTFQIQIPKSSVNAKETVEIGLKASGTYVMKKVYDYYIEYNHVFSKPYQHVIYGKVFSESFNVFDGKTIKFTKPENKLTINKVDQNNKALSGAKLALYSENCLNSTCKEEYATWTSTTSGKTFENIPVGNYTLVELSAPNGYKLAAKKLIKIDSNNKEYTISMVDLKELTVRISKTDVTGQKEIPGATLVLKNSNGVVESWVSKSEPHYVTLEAGEYELTETIAPKGYVLSKTTISFKLDSENNVYQKNANGQWVKVDYIKMVNLTKEAVNISKLDSETNEYVIGAKLQVKNDKGEVIATWTTTNESYYLSLEEGSYILEEVSAPKGYILNKNLTYFKVDADANVYVVNSKGEYVQANGVIMYNEPETIIVPATGLSSTIIYVLGVSVLGFGAITLFRNEKEC